MHLVVSPRVRSGAILAWSGRFAAGTTFLVQYSDNGVDFEDLGTTDDLFFEDEHPRHFGAHSRVHYRVTAEEPRGRRVVVTRQALGDLSVAEWGRVTAMRRNESLQCDGAGMCGWILKRRISGQKCPSCRDYDVDSSSEDEACTVCYGTGFTGGYYTPVLFPVRELARTPRSQSATTSGTDDQSMKVVQAPACIWLDSRDLWINRGSDERSLIEKVEPIYVRNIPAVYKSIQMRRVSAGSVIYGVPRPDDG